MTQATSDADTALKPTSAGVAVDSPGIGRRAWAQVRLTALFVVGIGVADSYRHSLGDEIVSPGVTIEGQAIAGATAGDLAQTIQAGLSRLRSQRIELRAGEKRAHLSVAELGGRIDAGQLGAQAFAFGRSGQLVQDLWRRRMARSHSHTLRFHREFSAATALDALIELAPELSYPGRPMYIDFEERRLMPGMHGQRMAPHDSLSDVAMALARSSPRVDLSVGDWPAPPLDPASKLVAPRDVQGKALNNAELPGSLALARRLGFYETPHSLQAAARARTQNLRLASRRLDGVVLRPGETLSFNAIVGPRDAESGFLEAPGISAGEIVDVLGGGVCQVASSLFAAAFFGGLDIVQARPHSRPSSYVDMGLDATVVWPDVDLVLRNPYDFAVLVHMAVEGGMVRAELFAGARPHRVVFERELKQEFEFERKVRFDASLARGERVVAQRGRRGFELIRRRQRLPAENSATTESEDRPEVWRLHYPPTREIIVVHPADGETFALAGPPLPPLRSPKSRLRLEQ